MDIKKSNILEHRFKLSSFGLKIYNVNAGNHRYASVSSVCKGVKKKPHNSQSEARLY